MTCIALHIERAVKQVKFNILANYTKTIDMGIRTCSTSLKPVLKEKWDLVSAVCIQRKPIISKERTEIEEKYLALLTRIEFANSFLSDHELRHLRDKAQAEQLKKGDFVDADVDLANKQTAQDFEDSCLEELKNFRFAPRTTEADEKNDNQSLDRKLDRSLLLLIEQKLGEKNYWVLPQGIRSEGETMRQTAERILNDTCGSQLKVRFMGNAPCGFYKYKYPKCVRETEGNSVGAKVFFFKAERLTGQIEKEKTNVNNFRWLVKEELLPLVASEYYRHVSNFLFDESHE